MRNHRTPLLMALLMAAASVHAQDAAGKPERASLEERRAAIEADYAQNLRDCAKRFNVNACELDARRARGAALKPIDLRELELDARERELKAAQQRERVLEKQRDFAAEDAQRKQQSLLEPRPAAVPAGKASKPAAASTPAQSAAHARELEARAEQARREAERRSRESVERERRASEHREEVLKRQRARAAKSAPAASLPLPSASDIAALPDLPASGNKP